jgi:hypothetical protein
MKSNGFIGVKQVKKKTAAAVPVLVRIPQPLLKKLDTACEKKGHSRTFELCIRLGDSFKKSGAEKVAA